MILIDTSKKRWLKISLVLLLLIIIAIMTYGFIIYNDLMQQKESGYDQSMEQVLAETPLETIDTKYKYHGKDNYHIFFGSTNDKQKKLVFYPLDDDEITILDESEMINEDDVKEQWKKNCQSCTLIKVRPAIDDETPLWELTYKDEQDRLILKYVSIKDGSDYETYRFKQMFK